MHRSSDRDDFSSAPPQASQRRVLASVVGAFLGAAFLGATAVGTTLLGAGNALATEPAFGKDGLQFRNGRALESSAPVATTLGRGFFLGRDASLGTSLSNPLGLPRSDTSLDLSSQRIDRFGNGFGREPDSRPNAMFGGFRFNRHFSVELGMADFEADERLQVGETLGGPLGTNRADHRADLSGMSAALTGAMPLGSQVNVFGKAGLFRWELDAARSATRIDDPEEDRSSRGYQLQLGIGSDWRLNDRFSLGAQWEYLSDLDTATPSDDHVFTGRFRFDF